MKYFEAVVRLKHTKGYEGFVLKCSNQTQAKKLLRANGYSVKELKEIGQNIYTNLDSERDFNSWDHKTFDDKNNLVDYDPVATKDLKIIVDLYHQSLERKTMKNTKDRATITPMIKELESLFSKLNERYFDGKLETPVITIAPDTCRAYGWFTTWRAWKETDNKDGEGYYEINITSDYLDRTPVEIAATLLHEMVHLFNAMKNINDCSRGGKYHNVKFKEAAESHGLLVEKDSRYGWSQTIPTEETKAYLKSLNLQFTLYRPTPKKGQRVRKKSSTRKYVCPVCGTIIRATKEVHVTCSDCDVEFEEVI